MKQLLSLLILLSFALTAFVPIQAQQQPQEPAAADDVVRISLSWCKSMPWSQTRAESDQGPHCRRF